MLRSSSLAVLALCAASGALAVNFYTTPVANITTTMTGLPSHTGVYEAAIFNVQSGMTTLTANCPWPPIVGSSTTISCTDESFVLTYGSSSYYQTSASRDPIFGVSTVAVMTSICRILPSSTVSCTVTGTSISDGTTERAPNTNAIVMFEGAATFVVTSGQERLPVTTTPAVSSPKNSENAAARAVVFAPGVDKGLFVAFFATAVSTLILAAVL